MYSVHFSRRVSQEGRRSAEMVAAPEPNEPLLQRLGIGQVRDRIDREGGQLTQSPALSFLHNTTHSSSFGWYAMAVMALLPPGR